MTAGDYNVIGAPVEFDRLSLIVSWEVSCHDAHWVIARRENVVGQQIGTLKQMSFIFLDFLFAERPSLPSVCIPSGVRALHRPHFKQASLEQHRQAWQRERFNYKSSRREISKLKGGQSFDSDFNHSAAQLRRIQNATISTGRDKKAPQNTLIEGIHLRGGSVSPASVRAQ